MIIDFKLIVINEKERLFEGSIIVLDWKETRRTKNKENPSRKFILVKH
jgi:hypothetical protein